LFKTGETAYGIIMVMGEEAKFYSIDEHKRYKLLKRVRKKIPNNHRRGGQSQARIGRLRDEHIHRYLCLIEEAAAECYTSQGVTTVKRLILSGPGIKKEQVRDKLKRLKVPISLLTEQSFEGVVDSFDTILHSDERADSKECIDEIQEIMRVDCDKLVFGVDIRPAFHDSQLRKVWVKNTDEWKTDGKTQVIELNDYYLDGFGGSIGLRW
jgi:peptide subunit release factor 1 (eRF1)